MNAAVLRDTLVAAIEAIAEVESVEYAGQCGLVVKTDQGNVIVVAFEDLADQAAEVEEPAVLEETEELPDGEGPSGGEEPEPGDAASDGTTAPAPADDE